MRIGVLKETKTLEFRVGLVSSIVENLAREGHEVLVEAGAGLGVGIADAEYTAAGARIASESEVFERAD